MLSLSYTSDLILNMPVTKCSNFVNVKYICAILLCLYLRTDTYSKVNRNASDQMFKFL